MTDKLYFPEGKFILDACCGGRMIWFTKRHPKALYIDIRREKKGFCESRPFFEVQPDIQMDFRKMEFPSKRFKLVVWDPPHIARLKSKSFMKDKFGNLNPKTWRDDLTLGFRECWRVLDDYGVLVFKWSEDSVPLKEVLGLFEQRPLFGHSSGKAGGTKWMTFMKIPKELH